MRRVNTLRAKVGTYTDRQTGQEKNSYRTIGHVLLDEQTGQEVLKIDSIPVEFNGWLYRGELEQQQMQPGQQTFQQGMSPQPQQPMQQSPQQARQQGQQQVVPPMAQGSYAPPNDDIPF